MEIRLVVTQTVSGKTQELDYALDETLVLGRSPASPVQFEGTLISREHVAFTYTNGQITLRDLSSNGTWCRGERIAKDSQFEVKHGDFIELPGYRVEIRIPGQEPVAVLDSQPSDAVDEPEEELKSKLPWLEPVGQFFSAFNGLEVFVSLAAVCCFGVVLLYALN
jgi:pSer/pThr/pTyr-binding forkhead associated (FHA) protein